MSTIGTPTRLARPSAFAGHVHQAAHRLSDEVVSGQRRRGPSAPNAVMVQVTTAGLAVARVAAVEPAFGP